MSNNELIELLNRLRSLPKENEYVEFKENNYEPKMIGERISALSNGAALMGQTFGYLVFGINDKTHEIVGTSFKPTQQKVENEELENWLAQRLSPRIDFRISEFEYQDKHFAIFQIPAANGQPVAFTHIGYIRIGSITRSLKDFPEKERKLWQKSESNYELEFAMKGVSAAEVVNLLDTQMVFDQLLKQPYPTTQAGVMEKLIAEKLIVRSNGHFHITNLGALLFAKKLDVFDMERKGVRVIKYKGTNKLYTEKDQIWQLGYGSGFQRLMNYISALLPSNEVIELAIRKEVTMYPLLAVRELVANAIIHQDLRLQDTYLTIEIYDDRIEICNPGTPTIDINRFIDGNSTRNKELAKAMRLMGFCEEKGSGIDKLFSQCEAFQLPAPDFMVRENQTIAILFAHQDLSKMNAADKVRACYQHCSLMFVSKQKMTNQSLRERFKVQKNNTSTISKIIKDTLQAGLIKVEDPDNTSRKFVTYLPYWG